MPPKRLNFSHAARTEGRLNFVRAEFVSGFQHKIPRSARDFACGLPLRSRPQTGSTSPMPPAPSVLTISSRRQARCLRKSRFLTIASRWFGMTSLWGSALRGIVARHYIWAG
jgi:hypothetical protein